jgi:hypothetical protein
VGATDTNDALAYFSNYGSYVDLTAPGVNIMTTTNGAGYGTVAGTSFSAPIVAGVAALVLSRNPSLTAQQLVDLLEQNADDLGAAGYDQIYGWGRVNASRAVSAAGGSAAPPVVTISNPGNSSTVIGTAYVQGTVSTSGSISHIDLWVDGAKVNTTTASQYSFPWNTTTTANGWHTVTVMAYDGTNNSGQAQVTLNVNNPPPADTVAPTVSLSSPANSSTVAGLVSVQGTAADNVSVQQIQFFVDGMLQATASASPFSFLWDSSAASSGNHTILVRALDPSGNAGQASATVNVGNSIDITPPTVSISLFSAGSNNLTVQVAASDNVRVTQLSLYLDGALYGSCGLAQCSFSLNTKKIARGSHTLTAKAWDAAGNVGVSAPVTFTK